MTGGGAARPVALHDHPSPRTLAAKGLLAYPHAQGGTWMRAAKTTYSVPPPVWKRPRQHPRHATKTHDTPIQRAPHGAAKALLERIEGARGWQSVVVSLRPCANWSRRHELGPFFPIGKINQAANDDFRHRIRSHFT